MSDKSIINFSGLGQLAKPVEKLIEKVSSGIGILYEPTQIRRKAKAEADAREIETKSRITTDQLLAKAGIENRELGQRALARLAYEETKAQQNMEEVLTGATHYLNEDADPDKIDNDWLTHFFNKCRQFSDQEMQDIWSKILAGEANKTGSFSKRTIELLSTISKEEAEMFTRLCGFVLLIDTFPVPIVFNSKDDIYKKNDIHFSTLQSLESIGLIHHNPITAFMFREVPEFVPLSYQEKAFILTIPKEKNGELIIGLSTFSPMGKELFKIIQAPDIEGIIEYISKKWSESGYHLSIPVPNK